MSNFDANSSRKDSLINEINALFAPPTAESYGRRGLVGIPSARRARKGHDNGSLTSDTNGSSIDSAAGLSTLPHYNRTQLAGCDDPFWRKPRANCHEYCDSCGCTEGERLVCDRCPASFHLECLDPPLEPEEAPIGVWFCHKCSMVIKDEEDETSNSSSVNSTAATDTGSNRSSRTGRSTSRKEDGSQPLNLLAGVALSQQPHAPSLPHPKRSVFIARAMTNERTLTGRSSRSAAWGESAYVADTEDSDLRALWNVIKYAQYQNPKEFDLPKDLIPGIKLPGSYKTTAERKNKSIIDLENGIVPRPVRRCFVCSRTCMFAPLLPCDYCSSCFHLECLDPPLPHFPPRSDRWMCPNHVEHTVDRYLVRSIRLTERMHIWSELNKVTTSTEPCSEKRRRLDVDSAKVKPEAAVQSQTTEPEDELVTNSEDLNGGRAKSPPLEQVAPYELAYGPDEEAVILADLMRKVQRTREDQSALALTAMDRAHSLTPYAYETKTDVHKVAVGRGIWRLTRDPSDASRFLRDPFHRVRIVVPDAVKSMYTRRVKRIPRPSEVLSAPNVQGTDEEKQLFVRSLLQFYLGQVDDDKSVDTANTDPIKPENSESQIPMELGDENNLEERAPTPVANPPEDTESATIKDLSSTKTALEQLLLHNDGTARVMSAKKLAQIDLPLLLSLADQRIKQLVEADGEAGKRSPIFDASFASRRSLSSSFTIPGGKLANHLRARAVLTPCGGTFGPSVKMHYRQLTIGTSPDCQLCLSDYHTSHMNQCQFCSVHHATIFYDEWTHHFELLNYSEHGTQVDRIVYRNDSSNKAICAPKKTKIISGVRDLIHEAISQSDDQSTEPNVEENPRGSSRMVMIGHRHEHLIHSHHTPCDCVGNGIDSHCSPNSLCNERSDGFSSHFCPIGYEGSAVLRHGSVLQFGCYQFVLGLVDYATADSRCLTTNRTADNRLTPPVSDRVEITLTPKSAALLVHS